MTSHSRSKKNRAKKPAKPGYVPFSVTTKDGKTTVRQYKDRRFIRLGEIAGKSLAYLEIHLCKGELYTIVLHFRDRTKLDLQIDPGFTLQAEYLKPQGLGDPRVLKRWPPIRS